MAGKGPPDGSTVLKVACPEWMNMGWASDSYSLSVSFYKLTWNVALVEPFPKTLRVPRWFWNAPCAYYCTGLHRQGRADAGSGRQSLSLAVALRKDTAPQEARARGGLCQGLFHSVHVRREGPTGSAGLTGKPPKLGN